MKSVFKGFKRVHLPLLLFFITFAVNALLSLKIRAPHIIPDELNTFSFGAFLGGNDWSSLVGQYKNYCGYGQSILYAPLFWIFKDSLTIYHGALMVNALIISFIPVVVYNICKKFFSIENKFFLISLSLIAAFYPSYTILSKFLWNESLIALLTWVILYVLLQEAANINKKRKIINSSLLAFLMIYGYNTHARFMGIIATALFMIILFHIMTKKKLIYYIPFVITAGILLFINSHVMDYFARNIWQVDSASALNNTFGQVIETRAAILFSFSGMKTIARAFFGNSAYAIMVTFGMASVAITGLVYSSYHHFKNKNKSYGASAEFLFGLYALLGTIASIAVGVIFLSADFTKADFKEYYFIYGRYVENLCAPVILFAICYILKNKGKITTDFILSAGFVSLLFCLLALTEIRSMGTKTLVEFNITSLIAFAPDYNINFPIGFVVAIILIFMLTALVLYITRIKFFKTLTVFLLAIFAFSALNSYCFIRTAANIECGRNITAYHFFKGLNIDDQYKNLYLYDDYGLVMQVYLNKYHIYLLNDLELMPENGFAIAYRDLNCDMKYKEFYEVVVPQYEKGIYIWVKDGDLKNRLQSMGIPLKKDTQ